MKRVYIVFIFFVSGLFGQDNPMFDSLNYFQRNKIKTIYCEADGWWYGHPFKKWEIVFDKDKKTVRYKSIVPRYTDAQIVKGIISSLSQDRYFYLRDTVFYSIDNEISREIKYTYDTKTRLQKKVLIDYRSTAGSHYGFRFGRKDTNKISSDTFTEQVKHITSMTYYYSDTVSERLKKIIEESPYFIAETNFYYEKFLLSMKTKLDSNKTSNQINFETTTYDYYPDRKLMRETRRVADNSCPGIAGNTICQGVIEYKYDTEFKNDLTPIPSIPYVPLITVKNRRKSEIYIELWGYDNKADKPTRISSIYRHLRPDALYEIVYDPRPDRNCIHERRKDSYFPFDKNKYNDIEVRVYTVSNNTRLFAEKEKILFTKKYTVESLFKKHKIIKIR